MPAKQTKKRSSAKEDIAKSAASSSRKSSKPDFCQFTEARYKKMSDKAFVKAFEEDNKNEARFYTQMRPQLVPFFMANIDREDREELQEQIDCEEINLEEWLESYPDLIDRLPSRVLWQLGADERLMLLIHCPEKAEFLVPMLQGDDIWAFMLPRYREDLCHLGATLCPWETMTPSQIRYMKLKSAQLKKFIESKKLG